MADVSKINGYDLKDATARQEIETLKEQVENIEMPEVDTSNLVTKEELQEFEENLVIPIAGEFYIDDREVDEAYEGYDVFSIDEGTVKTPEGNNAVYYRIPALTVSAKKTIIAFTDVRYDVAADNSGRISVFCRRSEDKGLTWGDPIEVCKFPTNEDGTQTSERARSMDSTVIASKSGKLFCLNGAWKSNSGNWSTYTSTPDPDWLLKLSVSEDDGLNWTTYNLNELPDMFTGMPSDLVSMLGGVGQGIQMYDGTLVFPVQLTRRINGSNSVCATIIYSEDDGLTWTMASGFAPASSGEDNVVEIAPGQIMMNARGGNARPCFITKDMGKTWENYSEMSGKIGNGGVGCQGSSSKITLDGKEVFLHSSPINPSGGYQRDNITLYASYDWKDYDLIRTYYPELGNAEGAGYSCLAPAEIDGQLCLFTLYERQGNIAFRSLGVDLEKIANRSEEFFKAPDREFETNKSSLLKLLESFASSELVIFNMLDHYLNNLSDAERSLVETQMVKISGINERGKVIDRGGIEWEIGGNVKASGNTFYFNGSTQNYIRTRQLQLTTDYTIDFDVYINGTTSTNWNWLFSLDNGSTPGCGLAINDVNTWNPAFDYNGSQTYTDEDDSFIGKWIHITVTKSAAEGAKIYHDTVLRFANPSANYTTGDYQNFTIGNNSALAKEFNGKISNFKIYNKIVTEEEMQHLYNNRKHTEVYTFDLPTAASEIPEELREDLLSNINGYKIGEFGETSLYDAGSSNVAWTINGETEYDLANNKFIFNNNATNSVKAANFLDVDFTVDFDICINSAPGTTWTQVFCIGNDTGTPGFALGINGTDTWNPAVDGNGSKTYTDPNGDFVGKWIHLTAVKSSTNGCSFYHDGVLVWNSQTNGELTGTNSVSGYSMVAIGNNTNPVKQFNGEIANFRIYDRVLTEEEIQSLARDFSERIVRKAYSPNGIAFMDEVEIDFAGGESLCIDFDLSTCTGSSQNVISIGAGIGSWSGNNLHFYYYPDEDRMLTQCMVGGSAQNIETTGVAEKFTIVLNSEGLTINDTLHPASESQAMQNVLALTTVQVGSTEGSGRSYASNYNIVVR